MDAHFTTQSLCGILKTTLEAIKFIECERYKTTLDQKMLVTAVERAQDRLIEIALLNLRYYCFILFSRFFCLKVVFVVLF